MKPNPTKRVLDIFEGPRVIAGQLGLPLLMGAVVSVGIVTATAFAWSKTGLPFSNAVALIVWAAIYRNTFPVAFFLMGDIGATLLDSPPQTAASLSDQLASEKQSGTPHISVSPWKLLLPLGNPFLVVTTVAWLKIALPAAQRTAVKRKKHQSSSFRAPPRVTKVLDVLGRVG